MNDPWSNTYNLIMIKYHIFPFSLTSDTEGFTVIYISEVHIFVKPTQITEKNILSFKQQFLSSSSKMTTVYQIYKILIIIYLDL